MRSSVAITLLVSSLALASPLERLSTTTLRLSSGTGFILQAPSGKKYLVTNWHVCEAMVYRGILYGNYESGELVKGAVVKEDPAVDLCAAEVAPSHEGISVGVSLSTNDELYTRGYPFGVLSETQGKYIGIASWVASVEAKPNRGCPASFKPVRSQATGAILECSRRYDDILTDMYARPGSSGSPVVNGRGELVGVISSYHMKQNAAGLVKLADIKKFVEDL